MILRMNRLKKNENEWTQKKNTHVEKILVLTLLSSKLLNQNYRPK